MPDYSNHTQDQLNDKLKWACRTGNLPNVAYLLTSPQLPKHAQIHFHDDVALQLACKNGHLDMVAYLLTSPDLKERANIHADDDFALAWACQGHLQVVTYLLTSPELTEHADIHANNDRGLRWAFEHGHMSIVSFLLYDMKMQVLPERYEHILSDAHKQELMRMIAKRDLFFKMNSSLSEIQSSHPIKPKI